MATFSNGEVGTQSKLVAALTAIRDLGSSVVSQLEDARLVTLMEFERRLSSLNGRRQRGYRIPPAGTLANFVISDFLDINQRDTTATVRIDGRSVSLRERSSPTEIVIRNIQFSTSDGMVEELDQRQVLYRVTVPAGITPTGTFDIQLTEAVNLSLLILDISPSPSQSHLDVQVSANGVSYTAADHITQNGYRINAWVVPQSVMYIRVTITPSHPDAMNGTSFTFGLTDFHATATDFHLMSELVSKTLTFAPAGRQMKFVATSDPNLTYFLNFAGQGWQEVNPDDLIVVPGATAATHAHAAINGSGVLDYSLPGTTYPTTLTVTKDTDNTVLPVVAGLSAADPNVTHLQRQYVGLTGVTLTLICASLTSELAHTFSLAWVQGPASLSVQLKVRLTTTDRSTTPIFRGASLQSA